MASQPLAAAVISATGVNVQSIFATAKDGDTIVLSGVFGRTKLDNRSFASGITIDASNAQFNGQLTMRSVSGVTITGGLFGLDPGVWQNGNTVRIDYSSRVSLINPTVVGAGVGRELGISFIKSNDINVRGGRFTGLRLGIGVSSVTNATLISNTFANSTSDGINIVDSHRVTASANICKSSAPSAGAHPDCIQMWSGAGLPMQSDIMLFKNKAYGLTQGFTSFDPTAASAIRMSMIGNLVNTSLPQGIACYGCFDSVVSNNTVLTIPGSQYRTMLHVPGGANNIVMDNSIGPFVKPVAFETPFSGFAASDSQDLIAFSADESPDFDSSALTSRYGESLAAFSIAAAVPEPAVWLQLVFGLGCAGALLRQRRGMTSA
jgi:parallel beta-helix repeat protein